MFSGASSSPTMSPSSLTLCAARLLWYVFTLHGLSADFDSRSIAAVCEKEPAWIRSTLVLLASPAPADASRPSSSEEGPRRCRSRL